MLFTQIASISATTVSKMVAIRVLVSKYFSRSFGNMGAITLLHNNDAPARSELSAELIIAAVNAAIKIVNSTGLLFPRTMIAIRGST